MHEHQQRWAPIHRPLHLGIARRVEEAVGALALAGVEIHGLRA